MPRTVIIVEIPHKGEVTDYIIHEVLIGLDMPLGPQRIGSYDRFFSGTRRYASKEDEACYQDSCCWGPTALFHRQGRVEEWEKETKETTARMRKFSPTWPDHTTFPRTQHANILEFYKHIGFDRFKRCYRDKDGNPIKYSLRPSKPRGEK